MSTDMVEKSGTENTEIYPNRDIEDGWFGIRFFERINIEERKIELMRARINRELRELPYD